MVAAGSVGVIMIKPAGQPVPANSSPPVTPTSVTMQKTAAAAWVANQVNPATTIACDQAMCAELRARGYPGGHLRQLSSQAALKSSGIVVVTPAARQLFGSSLATAYAPVTLVKFGSGGSAVSVRLVAPHGANVYLQAARQDQAARASAEVVLTQAGTITMSAPAVRQLKNGRVDGRLAEAITAAATAEPINILDFGNVGTGASSIVPLRYADLTVSTSAAGMSVQAYVQALRAGMNSDTGARPDRTQLVTLPGGQRVLRVEFLAPSPFGVLNSP